MQGLLLTPFQYPLVDEILVPALQHRLGKANVHLAGEDFSNNLSFDETAIYLVIIYVGWLKEAWLKDLHNPHYQALQQALQSDAKVIPVVVDGTSDWSSSSSSLPLGLEALSQHVGIQLNLGNETTRSQQLNTFLGQIDKLINHQFEIQAVTKMIPLVETIYDPVIIKKPNYLVVMAIGAITWGVIFFMVGMTFPTSKFWSGYYHSWDVSAGERIPHAILGAIGGFVSGRLMIHYAPGTPATPLISSATWACILFMLFADNGEEDLGIITLITLTTIPFSVMLSYWLPRPVLWWQPSRSAIRQYGLLLMLTMSCIFGAFFIAAFIMADGTSGYESAAEASRHLTYLMGITGLVFGGTYLPMILYLLKNVALTETPKNITVHLEN